MVPLRANLGQGSRKASTYVSIATAVTYKYKRKACRLDRRVHPSDVLFHLGYARVARILLANGATASSIDDHAPMLFICPLIKIRSDEAAGEGRARLGATTDPASAGLPHHTLTTHAASKNVGRTGVARTLIKAGANTNPRTPLYGAAFGEHLNVVRFCSLDHQANPFFVPQLQVS